jgi:carbon starvation protein
MYFATGVVIAIGVYLLVLNPSMAHNLWTMFASANQMLAALTLLTASLWLLKKHLKFWIALLPMVFMIVTSGTAVFQLFLQSLDKWMKKGFAEGGVTAIGSAALFCLAVTLLVLGAMKLRKILKNAMLQKIAKKG